MSASKRFRDSTFPVTFDALNTFVFITKINGRKKGASSVGGQCNFTADFVMRNRDSGQFFYAVVFFYKTASSITVAENIIDPI